MVRTLWLAVLLASAVAWSGCGDDDSNGGGDSDSDSDTDTDTDSDTDTDADTDTDTDSDTDTDADTDTDTDTDTGGFTVTDQVEFTTTMGTFVIGLYGNAAPITVTNFLNYVDDGFYDGLIFHRVIADFMIQGGGYDESMTAQPTDPAIDLEIVDGLSHQPGVISMARTTDPNSATSQFFICVANDDFLDGDYAAFGDTLSGYDVVESISLVETDSGDVPVVPVIINSAVHL
jgi:cyclophilin family peptidyl-prolyl cis-trans isomerase